MKEVLFVTQTLGLGGAEVFNADLLAWLTRNGCSVQAYCNNDRFLSILSRKGISTHRIPFVIDIIGDWKGLVKGIVLMPLGLVFYGLLAITNRHKVFLMTGFIEKILLTPWARLFGSKIVWIEFGPLEAVLKKFGGLPGFLYKLVSKMPSEVIMSSTHTQKANAYLGMKNVRVIPCAITPRELQVKTNPHLVVCVSRLEKGKGQDLLLEAWVHVIRKVPSALLRIVGEGDQATRLAYQVQSLRLENSVQLVGWAPDAVLEMARASVIVFPSLWSLEGFGIAAAEALSQAKPVIGFDRGPLPEIVDASCGILVPPGDILMLARAIESLLAHPKHAAILGKSGKAKLERKFIWGVVGPQFLDRL